MQKKLTIRFAVTVFEIFSFKLSKNERLLLKISEMPRMD
jgi:hypothetical protein